MNSVYVARAIGGGLVKIGMSRNPEGRVKQVAPPCGGSVELSHVVGVPGRARIVEKVAHCLLREFRKSGEWFDVSPDEALAAVNSAVAIVDEGRHEAFLASERPPASIPIMVKFDSDLLRDLDAWRASHRYPPSRSEVIRRALRAFLADKVASGRS